MIRVWRWAPSSSSNGSSSPGATSQPWSLPPPAPQAHDLPAPELRGDEVLVAVEASALSAHELAARGAVAPGGAAVGTVIAAGAEATDLVGKRVIVGPEQACGECDVCRRGHATVCPNGAVLGRDVDGTLASAVRARARWLCVLDDALNLPGPSAALAGGDAARAYAMYVRAGVAPGEPVVILGDSVVARFLVEIAISRGARPMIVTADSAFAAWVTAKDAVAVSVGSDIKPADVRQAALDAAQRGGHGIRPWYLFATDAGARTCALAAALISPGCYLVALGSWAEDPATLGLLVAAGGVCIGVAGAHPDLIPEVAALAVRGDLDLAGAAHCVARSELDRLRPSDMDMDRAPSAPRAWVITGLGQ